MNLRDVLRILRFERRRALAMSRVCEPVFAKDYLKNRTRARHRGRDRGAGRKPAPEKGKEMIKAEVNNGKVSLEMKGPGMEVVKDVLSIILETYHGFEETEKGAGEGLLGIIGGALRDGKIQEWHERSQTPDASTQIKF